MDQGRSLFLFFIAPLMPLLVPLLPLLSFAVLILFGRRLGKWSAAVSLLALTGSLSLCLFALRQSILFAGDPNPWSIAWRWQWLRLGDKPWTLGFQMDPLSITMCLVVTVVGWLIMLYSVGYMGADPRFSRFFAYLSLFFSTMLTLVLADNFLLLYIGWEGVGLCSYLLISFWFEKESAANAGKKAFLTTRIGDLGLLAAILLIAKVTGDVSFENLPAKAAALGAWGPIVAFLIFWGAAGKSAQFPLHVWLPDAMEGPTPVSALIHAATMVAAGVYLVARTFPLFLLNPDALLPVMMLAGITSFGAATIACTQTDLKRILAYSTISQLGLMMVALGSGAGGGSIASMFHLVTHAGFKALLFLGAGSVIHALHHQEITRMGGLWRTMPITALTFTMGAIAMAGIPPFSGFWSKEEILLSVALPHPTPFPGWLVAILPWAILSISLLTAFYITRAVILTFFGRSRADELEHDASHPHESPFVMTGPLVALALGAAGIGFIGSPFLHHAFQTFLSGISGHQFLVGVQGLTQAEIPAHVDVERIHRFWTTFSIAASAGGILLALVRYGGGIALLPNALRAVFRPIHSLVANKYYVDEIYERLFIQPVMRFAQRAFSFDARVIDGAVNSTGQAGLSLSAIKGWIDQHIVDGLVNGVGVTFGWAGGRLRLLQTGLVQNYLLIAAAGVLGIFFILSRMTP